VTKINIILSSSVVGLLLGVQLGRMTFCCFLCGWDSRTKTSCYKKRDWSSWSLEPGTKIT